MIATSALTRKRDAASGLPSVEPRSRRKPPQPILLGRHLIEMGVKPGPDMGRILKAVYELQLDSAVTTLEEARQRASELIPK